MSEERGKDDDAAANGMMVQRQVTLLREWQDDTSRCRRSPTGDQFRRPRKRQHTAAFLLASASTVLNKALRAWTLTCEVNSEFIAFVERSRSDWAIVSDPASNRVAIASDSVIEVYDVIEQHLANPRAAKLPQDTAPCWRRIACWSSSSSLAKGNDDEVPSSLIAVSASSSFTMVFDENLRLITNFRVCSQPAWGTHQPRRQHPTNDVAGNSVRLKDNAPSADPSSIIISTCICSVTRTDVAMLLLTGTGVLHMKHFVHKEAVRRSGRANSRNTDPLSDGGGTMEQDTTSHHHRQGAGSEWVHVESGSLELRLHALFHHVCAVTHNPRTSSVVVLGLGVDGSLLAATYHLALDEGSLRQLTLLPARRSVIYANPDAKANLFVISCALSPLGERMAMTCLDGRCLVLSALSLRPLYDITPTFLQSLLGAGSASACHAQEVHWWGSGALLLTVVTGELVLVDVGAKELSATKVLDKSIVPASLQSSVHVAAPLSFANETSAADVPESQDKLPRKLLSQAFILHENRTAATHPNPTASQEEEREQREEEGQGRSDSLLQMWRRLPFLRTKADVALMQTRSSFRLLQLQEATPEMLVLALVEEGNFDRALALAEKHDVAADPIYKAMWAEGDITEELAFSVFSKVNDIDWVLNEAVNYRVENLNVAMAVFRAGLTSSSEAIVSATYPQEWKRALATQASARGGGSKRAEDDASASRIYRWAAMRQQLSQRLSTAKLFQSLCRSGHVFTALAYHQFERRSPLHNASLFALAADTAALKLMLHREWTLLQPRLLDLLSLLPLSTPKEEVAGFLRTAAPTVCADGSRSGLSFPDLDSTDDEQCERDWAEKLLGLAKAAKSAKSAEAAQATSRRFDAVHIPLAQLAHLPYHPHSNASTLMQTLIESGLLIPNQNTSDDLDVTAAHIPATASGLFAFLQIRCEALVVAGTAQKAFELACLAANFACFARSNSKPAAQHDALVDDATGDDGAAPSLKEQLDGLIDELSIIVAVAKAQERTGTASIWQPTAEATSSYSLLWLRTATEKMVIEALLLGCSEEDFRDQCLFVLRPYLQRLQTNSHDADVPPSSALPQPALDALVSVLAAHASKQPKHVASLLGHQPITIHSTTTKATTKADHGSAQQLGKGLNSQGSTDVFPLLVPDVAQRRLLVAALVDALDIVPGSDKLCLALRRIQQSGSVHRAASSQEGGGILGISQQRACMAYEAAFKYHPVSMQQLLSYKQQEASGETTKTSLQATSTSQAPVAVEGERDGETEETAAQRFIRRVVRFAARRIGTQHQWYELLRALGCIGAFLEAVSPSFVLEVFLSTCLVTNNSGYMAAFALFEAFEETSNSGSSDSVSLWASDAFVHAASSSNEPIATVEIVRLWRMQRSDIVCASIVAVRELVNSSPSLQSRSLDKADEIIRLVSELAAASSLSTLRKESRLISACRVLGGIQFQSAPLQVRLMPPVAVLSRVCEQELVAPSNVEFMSRLYGLLLDEADGAVMHTEPLLLLAKYALHVQDVDMAARHSQALIDVSLSNGLLGNIDWAVVFDVVGLGLKQKRPGVVLPLAEHAVTAAPEEELASAFALLQQAKGDLIDAIYAVRRAHDESSPPPHSWTEDEEEPCARMRSEDAAEEVEAAKDDQASEGGEEGSTGEEQGITSSLLKSGVFAGRVTKAAASYATSTASRLLSGSSLLSSALPVSAQFSVATFLQQSAEVVASGVTSMLGSKPSPDVQAFQDAIAMIADQEMRGQLSFFFKLPKSMSGDAEALPLFDVSAMIAWLKSNLARAASIEVDNTGTPAASDMHDAPDSPDNSAPSRSAFDVPGAFYELGAEEDDFSCPNKSKLMWLISTLSDDRCASLSALSSVQSPDANLEHEIALTCAQLTHALKRVQTHSQLWTETPAPETAAVTGTREEKEDELGRSEACVKIDTLLLKFAVQTSAVSQAARQGTPPSESDGSEVDSISSSTASTAAVDGLLVLAALLSMHDTESACLLLRASPHFWFRKLFIGLSLLQRTRQHASVRTNNFLWQDDQLCLFLCSSDPSAFFAHIEEVCVAAQSKGATDSDARCNANCNEAATSFLLKEWAATCKAEAKCAMTKKLKHVDLHVDRARFVSDAKYRELCILNMAKTADLERFAQGQELSSAFNIPTDAFALAHLRFVFSQERCRLSNIKISMKELVSAFTHSDQLSPSFPENLRDVWNSVTFSDNHAYEAFFSIAAACENAFCDSHSSQDKQHKPPPEARLFEATAEDLLVAAKTFSDEEIQVNFKALLCGSLQERDAALMSLISPSAAAPLQEPPSFALVADILPCILPITRAQLAGLRAQHALKTLVGSSPLLDGESDSDDSSTLKVATVGDDFHRSILGVFDAFFAEISEPTAEDAITALSGALDVILNHQQWADDSKAFALVMLKQRLEEANPSSDGTDGSALEALLLKVARAHETLTSLSKSELVQRVRQLGTGFASLLPSNAVTLLEAAGHLEHEDDREAYVGDDDLLDGSSHRTASIDAIFFPIAVRIVACRLDLNLAEQVLRQCSAHSMEDVLIEAAVLLASAYCPSAVDELSMVTKENLAAHPLGVTEGAPSLSSFLDLLAGKACATIELKEDWLSAVLLELTRFVVKDSDDGGSDDEDNASDSEDGDSDSEDTRDTEEAGVTSREWAWMLKMASSPCVPLEEVHGLVGLAKLALAAIESSTKKLGAHSAHSAHACDDGLSIREQLQRLQSRLRFRLAQATVLDHLQQEFGAVLVTRILDSASLLSGTNFVSHLVEFISTMPAPTARQTAVDESGVKSALLAIPVALRVWHNAFVSSTNSQSVQKTLHAGLSDGWEMLMKLSLVADASGRTFLQLCALRAKYPSPALSDKTIRGVSQSAGVSFPFHSVAWLLANFHVDKALEATQEPSFLKAVDAVDGQVVVAEAQTDGEQLFNEGACEVLAYIVCKLRLLGSVSTSPVLRGLVVSCIAKHVAADKLAIVPSIDRQFLLNLDILEMQLVAEGKQEVADALRSQCHQQRRHGSTASSSSTSRSATRSAQQLLTKGVMNFFSGKK